MKSRISSPGRGAILRGACGPVLLAAMMAATTVDARNTAKTLLPAFPDAARSKASAVFSNAFYLAQITPRGSVRVTLLHEGKPVSPAFSLYGVTFEGVAKTGGYSVREWPDFDLKAESTLPIAQPTGPVKFRADAERGDRQTVSVEFAERSIIVDVKLRMTQRSNVRSARMGASVPGLKEAGKHLTGELPPEVMAKCQAVTVEVIDEAGGTVSFPFSETAAHRKLPRAREWSVRGRWNGYVVRGKALSKDGSFGYSQYHGTIPAHGFHFQYNLGKSRDSIRVQFEFEPVARTAGAEEEDDEDLDAMEGATDGDDKKDDKPKRAK